VSALGAPVLGPVSADPDDYVSFWDYFSKLYVPEMGLDLPLKKAHQEACEMLEQAFLGTIPDFIDEYGVAHHIQYVVINMPRRVGKTKLIEAWYTWAFGYVPDCQFIHTSYSQDLTTGSMEWAAKTMNSPWYQSFFGDLIHGKRADHITTTAGGNLYASGTSGTLTGKGGGLKRPGGGAIVIDDAAKPDEVLSPVVSKGVVQWFETTIKGCRNSDRWCPIIIIAQRLGKNDLPGHVQGTYPNNTVTVKFPALVDPDTGLASTADNAISAFPETISPESLLVLRKTRIGRYVLATQSQQEDALLGGNKIPLECFDRWDPREAMSMKWEKLVIPVDTALKTKQANDFSCAALWGLIRPRAYLIDMIHGKWESPELLDRIVKFWEQWGHVAGWPSPRLIIEEKAAGTPLLQNLKVRGVPARGIERDIDKVRRCNQVLPYIEMHHAVIPKMGSVPWIEKWEAEHAEFKDDGTHAHDDMCLVAGTLVTCLRGNIPIEQVRIGDQVLTRNGLCMVAAAGQTGSTSEVWTVETTDSRVSGTGSHPIWTESRGFARIDTTSDGDTVLTCEFIPRETPRTSLFSTGSSSVATQIQSTLATVGTTARRQTTGKPGFRPCIRKSGNQSTDRYRHGMTFTIGTETPQITHPKTSNVYSNPLTKKSIATSALRSARHWVSSLTLRRSGLLLPVGIHPEKGSNGIGKMESTRRQYAKKLLETVSNAASRSIATTLTLKSVRHSAAVETERSEIESCSIATTVKKILPEPGWTLIPKPVLSVRVRAMPKPVPVFNLTVEGANEFFANGILVHNCDTTFDSLEYLLARKLSGFDVLMDNK
jgi:predicted phage terminase large subunit-like protein